MRNSELLTLAGCALFQGISAEEIPGMLARLSATTRKYAKNQVIFAEGSPPTHIGIVLSGHVRVEQGDYWGNRTILASLAPGELFGEAFGWAGVQKLPVAVYAAEACKILFFDHLSIVQSCPKTCGFHARLTQNMLCVLAQKNVALTRKMETITQRTTRSKLLAYLSAQARQQGSSQFKIPFNRQELADYLSVDRSAMSSELSKMQREGILRFEKNAFALL